MAEEVASQERALRHATEEQLGALRTQAGNLSSEISSDCALMN